MSARGLLKRSIDRQIEGRQRFAYGYITSFDPATMRCSVEMPGDTIMKRKVIQDVLLPTFVLGLKPPQITNGALVLVAFDTEQKQTARVVHVIPNDQREIMAATNPSNSSIDRSDSVPAAGGAGGIAVSPQDLIR